MRMTQTIFEKIWDAHVVEHMEDGSDLLHIDPGAMAMTSAAPWPTA